MKPRIKHYRYHLVSNGISYGLSPKGGATVAYYFSEEESSFIYAVAICSFNDIFSKKLGTKIALGRLQTDHHYFLSVDDEYDTTALDREVESNLWRRMRLYEEKLARKRAQLAKLLEKPQFKYVLD